MPEKTPKPEETAVSSEGVQDHGLKTASGQTPVDSGNPTAEGAETCACARDDEPSCQEDCPDNDCSFVVTTFPEQISRFWGFGKAPYLLWGLVSLLLLALRITAMILCGEENGRFAVNIFKSLLPGGLGILIIYYSRQAKNVAEAFCELFSGTGKEDIVEETTRRIRLVFSNRAMIITGIILTLLFIWPVTTSQIYPTPVHNIKHRAGVRDRITVNVGLTKQRKPTNNTVKGEPNHGPPIGEMNGRADSGNDQVIWGWVQLPLGKVIHLAVELENQEASKEKTSESPEKADEIEKQAAGIQDQAKEIELQADELKVRTEAIKLEANTSKSPAEEIMKKTDKAKTQTKAETPWYKILTDPPQEGYEPHLPSPTPDEYLGSIEDKQRRDAIDPEWDRYFGGENASRARMDPAEMEKARKQRARNFLLLGEFYLGKTAEQLWTYSQRTYLAVMVPLLFMGGAMLWCVAAIIIVTWNIGRCPGNRDNNPFEKMDLTFYPHPRESVGAAGDLLWQIAFITGLIYSVLMICQFFAQPDTRTMVLAGMFSPLVVVLFIVPQYNLHKLMVDAKYKKINTLDDSLYQSLREIGTDSSPDDILKAHNILQLQKTMAETNDWPCDLKSLAMVVSSVVIPIFMAIFTLYEHFK